MAPSGAEVAMQRTFRLGEGRFWSISRRGAVLTISHGQVGARAQVQQARLRDEVEARCEERRRIRQKRAAGYRDATPPGALPPLSRTGEGLVAALAADPRDTVAHMAFADWLGEQPEPKHQAWGELIRTQLELEGDGLPPARKRQLRRREAALLESLQRDLLGEGLARALLELRDLHLPDHHHDGWGLYGVGFARGWADELYLPRLDAEAARAVAAAESLRLLRRLAILEIAGGDGLARLGRSAVLGNVRQLVVQVPAPRLVEVGPLLAAVPRLEQLHIDGRGLDVRGVFAAALPELRSLKVYGCYAPPEALPPGPVLPGVERLLVSWPVARPGGAHGPRACLADLLRPPHLPALRRLEVYYGTIGDLLCREIAASGALARLRDLRLCHAHVTDAGGRALLASPHLAALDHLDLTGNRLSPPVVRQLRRAGAKLTAGMQQPP
jgi:uncharacterized protein (TIGR02996 family)